MQVMGNMFVVEGWIQPAISSCREISDLFLFIRLESLILVSCN